MLLMRPTNERQEMEIGDIVLAVHASEVMIYTQDKHGAVWIDAPSLSLHPGKRYASSIDGVLRIANVTVGRVRCSIAQVIGCTYLEGDLC